MWQNLKLAKPDVKF